MVRHNTIEVVFNQHQRGAGGIGNRMHRGVELGGAAWIEMGARLVQDERLGPHRQRGGQRDALLLTTR